MNYFMKTVYSIATKTCPLAVYRHFSQAKCEGAKMVNFEKWGDMVPPRFRRHCTNYKYNNYKNKELTFPKHKTRLQ